MTIIPLSPLQLVALNICLAGLFLSVGIIIGMVIQARLEKV